MTLTARRVGISATSNTVAWDQATASCSKHRIGVILLRHTLYRLEAIF